jgi:hypothetical protein
MNKLYLIVGSDNSAVVNCRSRSDLDITNMQILGENIQVWEIGIAHPKTPPGCLLAGSTSEITRRLPIGRKA